MDKVKNGIKRSVTKITKKNFIMLGAILLIGGAVYLNWMLFSDKTSDIKSGLDDGYTSQGSYTDNDGSSLGESAYVGSADGNKNAAASDTDSYFATVQINRQRARDEAMEVLQLVVDNQDALKELKEGALADIAKIAANIESEANIETLVKAKGFEQCVAVVSDNSVNIVVKCDGLMPNEIAQIKEIVYNQAKITPDNIKIIEKN